MELQSKYPALHREPIIADLVIPDLTEMERTGNYDRNVLLWMQDGFVDRAIQENLERLRELHVHLARTETDPDVIRRKKNQELVVLTLETYSTSKKSGGGSDLKGYIEAARLLFETEAIRFGGNLQDIAEYIKKMLENGEVPDLDQLARGVYSSLAKMAGISSQLENLNGKGAAQEVGILMSKGISDITYLVVSEQPTPVGRELLRMVDRIGLAPEKYLTFTDPSGVAMPEREPWDFVPMDKPDLEFAL